MRPILCDVCKKDVGIRFFEFKKIHKEMDYGIEQDTITYELCSKKCLLELLDNIKEFTEKDKTYDKPWLERG